MRSCYNGVKKKLSLEIMNERKLNPHHFSRIESLLILALLYKLQQSSGGGVGFGFSVPRSGSCIFWKKNPPGLFLNAKLHLA